MKNWIKMVLASFFLFALVPMAVYAAGDKSGKLTVDSNKVEVSLTIPEGKTEAITSLRLQLRVAAESGTMDAPTFAFGSSIGSSVQDAAITQEEGGSYLVDLILSGKRNQDIFKGSENATLGILSVQPTSPKYEIKVEIIGDLGESGKPVAQYVGANGISAVTVELEGTEPAMVSKGDVKVTGIALSPKPQSPLEIGDTLQLDAKVTPENADNKQVDWESSNNQVATVEKGLVTAVGAGTATITAKSKDGSNVSDSCKIEVREKEEEHLAAPKLTAKPKSGSKAIAFSWKKVDHADGYELYEYNAKTKKDKLIKRVTNPSQVTFSKSYAYATTYSFRMRAFRNGEGGRVYGNYSSVVKATVSPANVKGISAYYKNNTSVSVVWKKVSGASGYEVYRSTKKNGKYTRVKTIKKGSTISAAISHKKGKAYYYKVRAYVTGSDKKPVYGNFCTAIAAKVSTPKLTAKASAKSIKLSWKKIPRASGYRIYKSRTKNGKYTLVKKITKGTAQSFTDKKVKGSSVWYYRICAFEKQGKKMVSGDFSGLKKVKVK